MSLITRSSSGADAFPTNCEVLLKSDTDWKEEGRKNKTKHNSLCDAGCVVFSGLEIFDPEEVEYIRSNATAAVGGSITLDCGATPPTIFIWGFTKPGTDNNVALAYNYGQGAKLQPRSGSGLGRMHVHADSWALVIDELRGEAEGMFTCQALYDTEGGARIAFYFTRLDME